MNLVTSVMIYNFLFSWSMPDICGKNGRKHLRRRFRKFICCSTNEHSKDKCDHRGKGKSSGNESIEGKQNHSKKKCSSLFSTASKPDRLHDRGIVSGQHVTSEGYCLPCASVASEPLHKSGMPSLLVKPIEHCVSEKCFHRSIERRRMSIFSECKGSVRSVEKLINESEIIASLKEISHMGTGDQNYSNTEKKSDYDIECLNDKNETEFSYTIIYKKSIWNEKEDNHASQDGYELFQKCIFPCKSLSNISDKDRAIHCMEPLQSELNVCEIPSSLPNASDIEVLRFQIHKLSHYGDKIGKKLHELNESMSKLDSFLMKVERQWSIIDSKHRRFDRNNRFLECRFKAVQRKEYHLLIEANRGTELAESEISLIREEEHRWMSLTKSVQELEINGSTKPSENPLTHRVSFGKHIEQNSTTITCCEAPSDVMKTANEKKNKNRQWYSLESVFMNKKYAQGIEGTQPDDGAQSIHWGTNVFKMNRTSTRKQKNPRKLITWKEIYFLNKYENT